MTSPPPRAIWLYWTRRAPRPWPELGSGWTAREPGSKLLRMTLHKLCPSVALAPVIALLIACGAQTKTRTVVVKEKVPCLTDDDRPPEWKQVQGYICKPSHLMEEDGWAEADAEAKALEYWVCIPGPPGSDAATLELNIARDQAWKAETWKACGPRGNGEP